MTQPPEDRPDDQSAPAAADDTGWAAPGPYGPPPSGWGQPPAPPPPPAPSAASYPPAGPQGYAGYAAPATSPKATWALVVGIISVVMLCCGFLGLIGVLSIVLGVQARREIAESRGALTGDGPALAGIVLGAIGAAGGAVLGLVQLVMFAMGDSSFSMG